MLLDAVEYRYVNGFAYSSPRPVSDEEVPSRFQRAEEVWEKKLWRDQVRDWDENVKPGRCGPIASCSRSTPTRSPTTSSSNT